MTRQANIAWFAVAAHLVASAAMLFLLREGLPPASDDERIAYITAHRAAWTSGWITWQVAILSLIALYAVVAERLRGALAWTALAITTVGAAIDLTTNIRYIVLLPELSGAPFALFDRELEMMTGYAANGLYSISLVIFTVIGRQTLPRLAMPLGAIAAAGGFALAIGALLHNAWMAIVSSAVLFPAFILWTIVIARWLRKSA
jgi:hypothetical protein